jgi:predicted component of type VI protein secretion system
MRSGTSNVRRASSWGPLTRIQDLDFLSVGSAYRALCNLAEFFTLCTIHFELQLILKREEARGVVLDYEGSHVRLNYLSKERAARP